MNSHATRSPWILVTGAAGFLGYHLIESLLRDNYGVIGIDNFDASYASDIKETNLTDLRRLSKQTNTPFTFLRKDVAELSEEDFQGVPLAAVIHLAGLEGASASLQAPEAFLHSNVKATLRILEICRLRHIDKVVLASTHSVYGRESMIPFREDCAAQRPTSPFASSKRAAELYCQTYAHLYGIKSAMLRLFHVYGPRQRPGVGIYEIARHIAAHKPLSLPGDGAASRDFLYVTDAVNAFRSAMAWLNSTEPSTCETFNVGSGTSISWFGLVRHLEKNLGLPAQLKPSSANIVQSELSMDSIADISKGRRLLAYHPQVALDKGIANFVDWFVRTEIPVAVAS